MLVPIHQTTSRHIPQISHNNVILLLVLNVVLQKYLYHVHDKKKLFQSLKLFVYHRE